MKNVWLVVGGVILLGVVIYVGYIFYKPSYSTQTNTNTGTTTQTTSQPNTVSIENFAFNPGEITVSAGTEVTFKNNDSVAHTVTFSSFQSGNISPGGEYKHVFTEKGTFDYHCSIHTYMKGKVIVQ